jgi:hypothetical protein
VVKFLLFLFSYNNEPNKFLLNKIIEIYIAQSLTFLLIFRGCTINGLSVGKLLFYIKTSISLDGLGSLNWSLCTNRNKCVLLCGTHSLIMLE